MVCPLFSHTVALQVTDNFGDTATGYTTVEILDSASVVSATVSPSNGEVPLSVSFTVTASDNEGISLYEWDFIGDGDFTYNSASSGDTTYTYTNPGNYTATLRVTDGQGNTTLFSLPTTTVRAAVPGSPTVEAASNPAAGDAPLTVTLSATASDPQNKSFVLWEWDFDGDGIFDESSTSSSDATYTYTRAGTWYPKVRVTTEDNRSASDVVEVKVHQNVTLSRDLDTIDVSLSQISQIQTTLTGDSRISLVIEDANGEVVRTLVDWQERTADTYTDGWDGTKDDQTTVVEGDYYAVLLYEEGTETKRLDLRNSSGGTRYNPSRNNAARTFAAFDNDPVSIIYQLPVASEVTAFMGYSLSNTRVTTFLNRKPQGAGSHTVRWYGTNSEGVIIQPPPGKYFMFGVWAYRLSDNAIYVKSGAHLMNPVAIPPLYNPTGYGSEGLEKSRISFTLSGRADVDLTVIDAQTGGTVALIRFPDLPAGENTIEWDGRNNQGELLAPGKYTLGLTPIDSKGYRSLTQYTLQRVFY